MTTFSATDRPENRTLIAGQMSQWHIQPSDSWEIGDVRYSPALTSILQAIVNRSDWSQGNALAFIITNSGSAAARIDTGGSWLTSDPMGIQPHWW